MMEMKIEILSRETVKPSKPTSHQLRTFKISLIDQFAPSLYVPVLLFYNDGKLDDHEHPDHLKRSISEALTIYYPLAGRFKDLISIDCNDEGVLYIEAHVNCSLSQFLENPDITFLNNFLPRNANCLEKDASPTFLVTIQTTKFKCGGLVIGACLTHKVVDASTISSFLDSWAKISSGLHDQVISPEFCSALSRFPPKGFIPPDFSRDFDNFYFKGSNFDKMRRFVFSAEAIDTLKARAASNAVPNPSRIEALTAFICERVMAAAATEKETDASKVLMVTHAVNLRQRIEPPLPLNSFGNIIWLAYNFCYQYHAASQTIKIELPDVVELVREMFQCLTRENLDGVDSSELFEGLSEVLGTLSTTDKLKIMRFTSWCNLGFYDVDFGWGKPVWVAYMGDVLGLRSKQHFLFLDGKFDKQIELWMTCDEDDISALEKDQEFLALATPNPGLCNMH